MAGENLAESEDPSSWGQDFRPPKRWILSFTAGLSTEIQRKNPVLLEPGFLRSPFSEEQYLLNVDFARFDLLGLG